MAVTVQVLEDGPRNHVVHLIINGANSDAVIVDSSTLSGSPNYVVLEKAEWTFYDQEPAVLEYEGLPTGDQTVLTMSGTHADEFCYPGGIPAVIGGSFLTGAITLFDYSTTAAISFTVDGILVELDDDYTNLNGVVTAIAGQLPGYTVTDSSTSVLFFKQGQTLAPAVVEVSGDASEFTTGTASNIYDTDLNVVITNAAELTDGTAILKFKKKYVKVEG